MSMSFTTPVVPGLDLDASKGPKINAVSIAFICLSLVTVAVRFFSRYSTNISVGIDDWLIVAAAVHLLRLYLSDKN